MKRLDPDDAFVVGLWFTDRGQAIVKEVDRLWPEENDPAYRSGSLAEEAGEVNRAITKRRHASYAADGKCKGKTVDEWTAELRLELTQALGVILDIAQREGIDLVSSLDDCVRILQQREVGT